MTLYNIPIIWRTMMPVSKKPRKSTKLNKVKSKNKLTKKEKLEDRLYRRRLRKMTPLQQVEEISLQCRTSLQRMVAILPIFNKEEMLAKLNSYPQTARKLAVFSQDAVNFHNELNQLDNELAGIKNSVPAVNQAVQNDDMDETLSYMAIFEKYTEWFNRLEATMLSTSIELAAFIEH